MISPLEYTNLVTTWIHLQPHINVTNHSEYKWSLNTSYKYPLLILETAIPLLLQNHAQTPINNIPSTLRNEDDDAITVSFELTPSNEIIIDDTSISTSTTISTTTSVHQIPPPLLANISVVYDITYKVLLLCLDIYNYASGEPISSLDVVLQYLPLHDNTNPMNAYITQVEHPYTERSVFVIHPCRTSEVISSLLSTFTTETDAYVKSNYYLLCWMQIYIGSLGVENLKMSPTEYNQCLDLIRKEESRNGNDMKR